MPTRALWIVALLLPLNLLASMRPDWNACSGDLARQQWAHQLPYEPLPGPLNYKWAGKEGAPVLVLLHGLDSAWQTFTPQIALLGAHYRLLLVDQRGHGASPEAGLDYWPSTMADDVLALTQSLGVSQFHLLGHSFGARTALRMVERAPHGTVLSFIIEDMRFYASRTKLDSAAVDQLVRVFRGRKEKFAGKTFTAGELEELLTVLYPNDPAKVAATLARRTRPVGEKLELMFRPWISAVYGTLCSQDDGTEVLKNMAIPVLDLRAAGREDDPVVGHEKVVTIPGSVHLMHGEKTTQAFADEVLKFLAEVEARGSSVIADAGTTPFAEARKRNMLPRGSAFRTSSGALAATGISHIIHAATGSSAPLGGEFEPTLASIRLSVLNSLKLAQAAGSKRVALPFIGGAIFLPRLNTDAETLARTIVQAALDGRSGLEIRIVAFSDNEAAMFQRILASLGAPAEVLALKGNITVFNDHGSDTVVNAANTEGRFGMGVSGAIAKASQNARAIDDEAAAAIAAYYAARP